MTCIVLKAPLNSNQPTNRVHGSTGRPTQFVCTDSNSDFKCGTTLYWRNVSDSATDLL